MHALYGEHVRSEVHPLAGVLAAAVAGSPPPVDGRWERIQPWRPDVFGVVAFTGHAYIAAPPHLSDDQLTALGADGFGGAHDPHVMVQIAGAELSIDVLDMLLAAYGTGRGSTLLVPRPDLAGHPRARRATMMRTDTVVYGLPDSADVLVTVAGGVAGLPELGVEIAESARGKGLGARVLRAVRDLVPAGEPLFAAVSPGNVASARAFLRAGFTLIGSVQLCYPSPSGRPA